MHSRLIPYLLLAPALTLITGLLIVPLVMLVRISLCEPATGTGFYTPHTLTLANFQAALDSHGRRILSYTLVFGLSIAGLTTTLALPLALFLRTLSAKARQLALACVVLPKLASILAVLFALRQLLPHGMVGALLAEAYLILPYTIVVVYVQVSQIPANLELTARGLGATRAQVFYRVTLPLAMPGILLAAQLSLIWGMGAFLGPMLLGGPDEITLAVEVHRQAFDYGRWPLAAADAIVLLLVLGVCLVVCGKTQRLTGARYENQ